MKFKRVVITGASGFLGRHIVEKLKSSDHEVIALTSKPEHLNRIVGSPNIEYYDRNIVYDYRRNTFFTDALVINCAYPRNLEGENIADGLRYIKSLFEATVNNCAESVINISTQSVYSSQRKEPATEKDLLCLETKYAIGKYATELMLEGICARAGIRTTNIRLASLIGPGFDQRIVNRLVRQAKEKQTLLVKKNSQRFGFFDIADATEGIIALMNSDNKRLWDPVYNLGNDSSYSLVEIAEAIRIVLSPDCDISIELEEDDCYTNSTLDARKFCKDFNFSPKLDLFESIKRIANEI